MYTDAHSPKFEVLIERCGHLYSSYTVRRVHKWLLLLRGVLACAFTALGVLNKGIVKPYIYYICIIEKGLPVFLFAIRLTRTDYSCALSKCFCLRIAPVDHFTDIYHDRYWQTPFCDVKRKFTIENAKSSVDKIDHELYIRTSKQYELQYALYYLWQLRTYNVILMVCRIHLYISS